MARLMAACWSRRGPAPVLLTMTSLAITWLVIGLTAAWSAPGSNCRIARTPVEALVCSDEMLAGLDRELTARYERLLQAVSRAGAAVLRDGQRTWLASRATCVSGPNAGVRDRSIDCLTELYQERGTALAAHFRISGGLTLEGRHVERSAPRYRVMETDDYPWLTGEPAARAAAFNRYLTKRLNLGTGMFPASGIRLPGKPEGDTIFSRFYEIHRFDGRLLSLEVFVYHLSHGGHGWRSEVAINWDLERSQPVTLADVFQPGSDWRQAVTNHALSWMRAQNEVSDPDSLLRGRDIDDDEAWLFGDDTATLLLGHGERSMAGVSAEIPVPYAVLAPYLRPDGPVTAPDQRPDGSATPRGKP